MFAGRPFQPHEVDMCWDAFPFVTLSSRPGRQDWATLEMLSPKAYLADVLRVLCRKSLKTPAVLSSSLKSDESASPGSLSPFPGLSLVGLWQFWELLSYSCFSL